MACKKPEGFFEGLVHDATSRSPKAMGMAGGMGHTSNYDRTRLGAMLWAEGAFKDD